MKIIIRETKAGDFDAIAELLQDPNISGPVTESQFRNMLRKNKGFFYVAEADGTVIGSVFGAHDGGYFGYIYKLVVKESHRRQKAGTKLLRKLVGKFKKAGIQAIFCHVRKTNEASIKLMQSLGFETRGLAYLMARKI